MTWPGVSQAKTNKQNTQKYSCSPSAALCPGIGFCRDLRAAPGKTSSGSVVGLGEFLPEVTFAPDNVAYLALSQLRHVVSHDCECSHAPFVS